MQDKWVVRFIKYLPNYITASRFLLAFVLLFLKPFSISFYIIYLICGVTDILDGYLARKMHVSSKLGQVLDSIADATLIGVLLFVLFPVLELSFWMFVWMIAITILRFISLFIGFIRFQAFAWIHTYANKLSGFILFCFPFLYMHCGIFVTIVLICTIATLSAIEECIINITAKTLNRDRKSLLME